MCAYVADQAVNYANQYWNKPNPHYPYFPSDDCTNYISQCLHAGGLQMENIGNRYRGWWMKGYVGGAEQWSISWTVAHALHWYLRNGPTGVSVERVQEAKQLRPGDVIQIDWNGDGRINHSTIVTSLNPNGEPLVNAHTRFAYQQLWTYRDSPAWTIRTKYYFFRIGD